MAVLVWWWVSMEPSPIPHYTSFPSLILASTYTASSTPHLIHHHQSPVIADVDGVVVQGCGVMRGGRRAGAAAALLLRAGVRRRVPALYRRQDAGAGGSEPDEEAANVPQELRLCHKRRRRRRTVVVDAAPALQGFQL
jgi:hypothetical protein